MKTLGFSTACASIVLATALVVGAQFALPQTALAEDTLVGKDYTWIQAGKKLYCWNYRFSESDEGAVYGAMDRFYKKRVHRNPISNITSLNPDTMTVKRTYGDIEEVSDKSESIDHVLTYNFKKYGTATVTYTLGRTGTGEAVTETHRYVKYTNPLKTLKIGTKSYTKKFKSQPFYSIKQTALKGKIKVKAKKGWKIVEIRKIHDSGDDPWNMGNFKKLKNGSKVSINNKSSNFKKCGILEVVCFNKSKKYYESVSLFPGIQAYTAQHGH